MSDQVNIDDDPCDGTHKHHEYDLRPSTPKKSNVVHTIQTLKIYNLLDLPEIVKRHSMVSCFHLTFENDKRFAWVLVPEQTKGFP